MLAPILMAKGQVDGGSPGAMKEQLRPRTMTEQTKLADVAAKKEEKESEKSQYQMKKEAEVLVSGWDTAKRKRVFNVLLEDWAQTLPQKGKDYGVTGSGNKWARRFEWLQDQLGTVFDAKGETRIRKMPISGVLELLTLFTLQAADSTEEKPSFGVLDDGSKLAEALVPQLWAMNDVGGSKADSHVKKMNRLAAEFESGKITADEYVKRSQQLVKELEG